MKPFQILIFLLLTLAAKAQPFNNFQLVDEFKINKTSVKVFFKDPLKVLLQAFPDFDAKPNKEKHELLDGYLHNNVLYVFQTLPEKGGSKSYILKGDENKLRTARFYNLQIVNNPFAELPDPYDNLVEKTIDKINIQGTFFEHMILFQNTEGKNAVGKLINIWGYFSMIQPYANIKETVSNIIKQDMDNTIPDDIIAKPEIAILPLFDYETCGLKKVQERTNIITVYQYNSAGKIINKYPRTEKDSDLYHASISLDDIGSTTAFPFFSAADTIKEVAKNIFTVNSTQKYLNHYLKDVRVFKNEQSGNIERIEGKLLIHGYSASGESVSYELYVAEFGKIGDCFLPQTIKFCSLDDILYKQPRILMNISYKFKE